MLKYSDMLSTDAPLILGVKLKPLSLGHVMHMQERECVFISPVAAPLLNGNSDKEQMQNLTNITNELILALTICSMDYEDFNDLLNNQLWLDDEKIYLTMQEYMERWNVAVQQLLKEDKVNLIQSIFLFNKYLSDGYVMPECENINNGMSSDIPTCDWITTLIESITSEINITREKLINQPLKLSFLQFFKLGERNGCIHFLTDDEKALRAMAVQGETVGV